MKNRRMICSAVIVAVLLYSVSCYAYTKVTQSGTNEAVIIEADGYSAFETVPVMILKPGKNLTDVDNATKDIPTEDISDVVCYMASFSADKYGKLNNEIDLSGLAEGHTYGIVVSGVQYDLKYVTNADRDAVIKKMIMAANANDQAALAAEFSANKDSLPIDNNISDACIGVSDAGIASVLITQIRGKSDLTVDEMSEIINKAMLVAALNAGKINDKQTVDHILDGGQYKSVNSMLEDKIKRDGLDSFIAHINNQAYTSVPDADTGIARELILASVCYPKEETTTAIMTILDNYNSILGLDLTEFNKLSEGNKGNAIRNFANQKPTLATMQSVLDGIVAPLKNSQQQADRNNSGGGGSGGGGGGGGGGSSSARSSEGAYMGMQSTVPDKVFNDIDGYSWAEDAITSLYSEGIISGYGDGSFAPQNNITREEFVKIAVRAFYKDAQTGTYGFADVPEDAWYYESISVAANRGIISGIGDGLFGVGQNITRQDMAVILCRIAGDRLERPENYNKFSDDEYIADYAREAVYALREKGVINGVSATEFAPVNYATRAETAVMVYRFFNLIGKDGV